MEKFSGAAFNTSVGKVVLKQHHPHGSHSPYSAHPFPHLAYFYTNIENSKCLLVDASSPPTRKLFYHLLYLDLNTANSITITSPTWVHMRATAKQR